MRPFTQQPIETLLLIACAHARWKRVQMRKLGTVSRRCLEYRDHNDISHFLSLDDGKKFLDWGRHWNTLSAEKIEEYKEKGEWPKEEIEIPYEGGKPEASLALLAMSAWCKGVMTYPIRLR